MLGCAQQEIEVHRRPIQQNQPFLESFHPMGLQFGHNTTANCELTATNRGE